LNEKSKIRGFRSGTKYTMVVCEEITERKLMEADLEDAHQRLLTVFNSMDAIVHVADMETYEILFLTAMLKIYMVYRRRKMLANFLYRQDRTL
jgi:hypothetical protein